MASTDEEQRYTTGDMALIRPQPGDRVTVGAFNSNFDTIDAYCTNVKRSVTEISGNITTITSAEIDALFT